VVSNARNDDGGTPSRCSRDARSHPGYKSRRPECSSNCEIMIPSDRLEIERCLGLPSAARHPSLRSERVDDPPLRELANFRQNASQRTSNHRSALEKGRSVSVILHVVVRFYRHRPRRRRRRRHRVSAPCREEAKVDYAYSWDEDT
jgi:hypothetical protein